VAKPTLHFKLRGAGWAELEISSEHSCAIIPSISYCTNALDDLVRIGINIATDKGFGAAVFDHEPATSVLVGETAWLQDDSWHRGARLSVVRDLSERVEPTFQWRASVQADFVLELASRDELARLFLDAALEVRREHGEQGYREQWGGALGYPTRAVAALEAALLTAPHEVVPYG
jgi:hypothetical protein